MIASHARFPVSPILIAVLTASVLAGAPQEQGTGLPASALPRIERLVTGFMANVNAPGVSVAVAVNGKPRWENGYGLADLENFVPTKASTVYRLASVSKPITAVAVLQLVERGRVSLADTVGKWLPNISSALRPITVEQLLSHQSGIRHYTAEEDDSTRYYPKHYKSLGNALDIFKDDPLLHKPGTQMTYSTYAYTLLGVIVEAASGQNYVDFVTQNIFNPAGMVHSRADDVTARSAGYAKTDGGDLRKASFMDSSYKIPGGGWLSTVGDMVRFGLALQDETLLRPETFARMTATQWADGTETFYGLGWIVEGWGPGLPRVPGVVWHGGVQQGVTTCLYMFPGEKSVVMVMTNLEGEALTITQLASEITKAALGR